MQPQGGCRAEAAGHGACSAASLPRTPLVLRRCCRPHAAPAGVLLLHHVPRSWQDTRAAGTRRTSAPDAAGAPPRPAPPLLQIAQFAAELERYPQAVKIYEDVARACVDNNLLKYRCAGPPQELRRQGKRARLLPGAARAGMASPGGSAASASAVG